MIGKIGYLSCEAKNDDEARAIFAVQLHHRGDGLYRRWRDAGMRIAQFKRGITREEIGHGTGREGVFNPIRQAHIH
jgi:hypothetical protein